MIPKTIILLGITLFLRGISSNGRALDSHSRGTGIDTRILQIDFLVYKKLCNGLLPYFKIILI